MDQIKKKVGENYCYIIVDGTMDSFGRHIDYALNIQKSQYVISQWGTWLNATLFCSS